MRIINIILTQNNLSGPFDIFYIKEDINLIAPLQTGGVAENITSSQLLLGINIIVPLNTINILIKNKKETCNTYVKIDLESFTHFEIPNILNCTFTGGTSSYLGVSNCSINGGTALYES